MKVLLFTHSQDIDGIGCAILLSRAFSDYKVVPTKTFDITRNVKEYIDNKKIYDYDFIYVTDLCVKEPVLKQINDDEKLRNKILILDHHKTEIEEGNDKYDFVNIIVEENNIKESATNLFYKYLVKNNYIKRTNILDQLVEYTRQYDTYDWKEINNQQARYLHILFENLGYKKYEEIINTKLNTEKEIKYNSSDMEVINNYFINLEKVAFNALNNMIVKKLNINDEIFTVGYVNCEYKYRNDLNEYVRKNNINDVDCIGMIMDDLPTVSYRCVKEIDVSKIGKYFGGKGHMGAATNTKDNELFKKLVLNKK